MDILSFMVVLEQQKWQKILSSYPSIQPTLSMAQSVTQVWTQLLEVSYRAMIIPE